MTIPIRGTAKGTPDTAYARAMQRGAQRPAFLHAYFTSLYHAAEVLGLNADVLVSQADLETDSFRSTYYLRDGNVAGFGAFDDGSNEGLTFTPEQAGAAHAVHMSAYLGLYVPPDLIAMDPRWQAVADAGYVGTVTTIDDLGNGRWATDPAYASKLLSRYTAYWGEPEPTKEPEMATYKVMLTDTEFIEVESPIPVKVELLPKSQKNQRPGYAMDPEFWIQHENGNPSSNARAERRYFGSGAEGRQASYHFVGDESEIIQMVPIYENTWQASDNLGLGNMKSISGSIAQGARDFLKARKGMATFAGNLMAHPKVSIPRGNITQHYDRAPNRKNCPQWIRDGGKWPEHKADIQRAYDAARQGGGEPVPAPVTYPKPIQIAKLDIAQGIAPTMVTLDDGTECVWVGDRVRAVRDTRRRQWAGEKAPDIGPVIPKGTEFDVDWLLKNSEGWWFYTPYDTRVKADDCERISDAKAAA